MNHPNHAQSNFMVFLLGALLNVLAAIDFTSLMDYSVKAIAGGLIWLVFKVLGEYLSEKIKNKQGNGKE